ncbi:MAG: energy-coupling factor ABC transporter ATP-binding protein [Acidaminococcaceae bacterium]|jgi:energy-coupling factor transport system ATP-binding protein|nr:energy-coupling factor ABC transporter ATP-binding protein [Acidaminococcaceae bacterium]MCI2109493.1 energy-coupling factor ABC transporter ATP-binding protein [Acidaminococcaceae bacterium]
MSETVINFTNFYFKYLNSQLVLKNVNLAIPQGAFTVMAGPSGAGKTTLCKAMLGIVPFYYGGSYSGDIEILGENVKGKRVSDLAMRVGLMLDDYESQLVSLTAGEEVAFSLLNHGFKPQEVAERTKKALTDVGLPGRENYQLDELSGGQRQRLLLASVLAVHPEVLVLDEPVSAMDPDGAKSLYALLYKIYKEYNMTVVVVEHDINNLLPYATHMVIVDNGQIAAKGPVMDAAKVTYDNPVLRENLPRLWQIKFNLEQRFGIKLGDWRSEEEAQEELQEKFQGRISK